MRLTWAAGADRGRYVYLNGRDLLARPGARAAQHPHARDRAGAAGRDELAEPCHAHPRTDPGRHRRARGRDPAPTARTVDQALGRVGLPVALADRFPHELSGGQKQRVAIAIATILSPSVIVADEPTSALDVVVQRQVIATLGKGPEGLGAAVILIGHDMGLVAQFADTIGVLYAGALVEYGPDDVLDNPSTRTPAS